MNLINLTKQERMVLVLQGILSEDHLTYEEVKELESLVMDKVANLLSTNDAPGRLQ